MTGTENIFNKVIEQNFPYLRKEVQNKVQEAYKTENRLYHKRNSPDYIIIKLLSIQNKERILKASGKKKEVIYKSRPIWITPYFSMETLKARRIWIDVLQTLREARSASTDYYTTKSLPSIPSITIDKKKKIPQ